MLSGWDAGANRDLTNGHAAMLNEHAAATSAVAVVRQPSGTVRQNPEAAGGRAASRWRMRWPTLRVPRGVLAVWLAWTGAAAFFITRESAMRLYRGERVPWGPITVGWLASMYIWAALTPAILWAGRRWPLDGDRRDRWRHATVHAGLSALVSAAAAALEAPVLTVLGVTPPLPGPPSWQGLVSALLTYSFHAGVMQYGAIVAVQAIVRSHQRAQAREREALAARLRALKMQLQPHFLFNTLGAIMVLVQQGRQREAEGMLARLSDLLRLVVDEVHTQEVPLWRELEFLGLYLSIEEVRFQDRLRVRMTTDPQISDALVPHMVLQPIVENAIRHGLGQSEDAVAIDIEARRCDGQLRLTVADDGPGNGAVPPQRRGVGLTNTESRLAALYGAAAGLRVESRVPHGVRVTVALPFRREEAECS
jgi:two-component system LytT family sensor kinase